MSKGIMLIGEPMALFMANSEGELENVSEYSVSVAGAELNVAIGLTRLGHSATYMTKLGEDPFGKRIVVSLTENGIGSEFVTYSQTNPTGFMLKGKTSEGDPKIFYFRKNSAASTISEEDIESVDFSKYGYLHLTGILPALTESTKKATFRLIEKARKNGVYISFDPNLRPQLWKDRETMVKVINELASKADIVFPGEGEGEILCGSRDPQKIGEFYLSLGAKAVVTKVGSKGAVITTADGSEFVEGFKVEKVVDTVGAGDGFAAGTLSGIMEDKSLYESVRRGNAVGAIQVTHRSDNEGLPTREELAAFMGIDTL